MLRHLMHHPIEIAIVLGVILALAVLIRIVIGNPNGARHRVRMLRWRIRLYLRPGPGYANLLELLIRWSRLAGGVDRRPGPAVAALVVAADDAGDQLRGPARPGALRAAGHRQHGRPDPPGRPAAEGQVRLVSGPDHRPPRRRGDHHHPHRPVREHRPAPRPGRRAARLQPRGHRRPRVDVPVEPAAGLRAAGHRAAAGGRVHRGDRVQGPARHDVLDRQGIVGAGQPAARGRAGRADHGRRLPVGARHRRRRGRADPDRPPGRRRWLARPDPGSPQARPDRRLDPDDGDPRAGLARRSRRRGGDLARPGRGLRRRRVRVRAQHPLHDRRRPGRGADRAAVPRVRRVRARPGHLRRLAAAARPAGPADADGAG